MHEAVAAAMQRLLRLGDSSAHSTFATVAGVRLHYLDAGRGPVVVLLHGGTGGGANWFRQLQPLASRFRVLAPDLPGFGLSDARPPIAPLGLTAASIFESWLRSLQVERATVVGTSFGGLVALRLAQRAPELVERLFLLDSAGLDPSLHVAVRLATVPFLGRIWARPTRRGTSWTFRTLLTHDRSTLTAEMQRALTDYLYLTARRAGTDYLLETLRRFAGPIGQREFLTAAELRQLRARTAIALGEHDHFFSTVGARHAASLIPNSSFRIIPGVGHSPNWEAPEAVLHAIVDHTAS